MTARSNFSRFNLSRMAAGFVIAGALTLLPALAGSQSAAANAEGQDVFIWVKPPSLTGDQDKNGAQFYYNRIAFNYAMGADTRE